MISCKFPALGTQGARGCRHGAAPFGSRRFDARRSGAELVGRWMTPSLVPALWMGRRRRKRPERIRSPGSLRQ
jgi:hypothetical protein